MVYLNREILSSRLIHVHFPLSATQSVFLNGKSDYHLWFNDFCQAMVTVLNFKNQSDCLSDQLGFIVGLEYNTTANPQLLESSLYSRIEQFIPCLFHQTYRHFVINKTDQTDPRDLACPISGLKAERTRQQTTGFPVPWHIYFHMPVPKPKQKGFSVSDFAILLIAFKWPHDSEGVNFLPLAMNGCSSQRSVFRRLLTSVCIIHWEWALLTFGLSLSAREIRPLRQPE